MHSETSISPRKRKPFKMYRDDSCQEIQYMFQTGMHQYPIPISVPRLRFTTCTLLVWGKKKCHWRTTKFLTFNFKLHQILYDDVLRISGKKLLILQRASLTSNQGWTDTTFLMNGRVLVLAFQYLFEQHSLASQIEQNCPMCTYKTAVDVVVSACILRVLVEYLTLVLVPLKDIPIRSIPIQHILLDWSLADLHSKLTNFLTIADQQGNANANANANS